MENDLLRFTVGKFNCMVIKDGIILVPGPPTPESGGLPDFKHGQYMDVLSLFIDTGEHKILLDTGCGYQFLPKGGRLLRNLQAVGIDPASIDTVIISHGHSDHVDGCFDPQGQPVFSGARFVVSRKEWDAWVQRPERESLHSLFASVRKYFLPEPEKFTLVEDGDEIVPGIRLSIAPGHTPGNSMIELSSGTGRLLCLGDLVHSPVEFTQPDYYAFLDVYPDQAVESRKRFLTAAAESGVPVFACHFPFPGLGKMVQKDGLLTWSPRC